LRDPTVPVVLISVLLLTNIPDGALPKNTEFLV
jgi:hypothetical protein